MEKEKSGKEKETIPMMNHGNTIKVIRIFPVQSKGKITIGMNRTKQASADKRKMQLWPNMLELNYSKENIFPVQCGGKISIGSDVQTQEKNNKTKMQLWPNMLELNYSRKKKPGKRTSFFHNPLTQRS